MIKNQRNTKLFLAGLCAVVSLSLTPLLPVYADTKAQVTAGIQATGASSPTDLQTHIKNIVGILLFVIGAVCVIAIIVGGISYATANGDQGKIKTAKDSILYAVIGLIVALLAYAITAFVTTNI